MKKIISKTIVAGVAVLALSACNQEKFHIKGNISAKTAASTSLKPDPKPLNSTVCALPTSISASALTPPRPSP